LAVLGVGAGNPPAGVTTKSSTHALLFQTVGPNDEQFDPVTLRAVVGIATFTALTSQALDFGFDPFVVV